MTLPGYEVPGKKYDLTYIALGAGVQSSALLLMSNLGLYDVPRADVAIFADTGAEPPDVYRVLAELEKASSIPVVRVSSASLPGYTGDLEADFVGGAVHADRSFVNLPLFILGENEDGSPRRGFTRRGCTSKYKIEPIERYVKREMLGLKPRQRVKSSIRAMMGISWDEAQRMKPSNHKWLDLSYPLLTNRIRREKCLEILAQHGGAGGWPRSVSKSACYFCPFHSNRVWKEMKECDAIPGHPLEGLFTRACEFDEKIRDQSKSGLDGKAFLHNSRKPLRDFDFTRGGQMEFDFDGAGDFTGCDSGHCGI